MTEDAVHPIRPGIEPEMDVERELIDFATVKIRDFYRQHGEPRSIAMVIIGEGVARTCSWTPKGQADRREVRAYAGARLLHDAIDPDLQ